MTSRYLVLRKNACRMRETAHLIKPPLYRPTLILLSVYHLSDSRQNTTVILYTSVFLQYEYIHCTRKTLIYCFVVPLETEYCDDGIKNLKSRLTTDSLSAIFSTRKKRFSDNSLCDYPNKWKQALIIRNVWLDLQFAIYFACVDATNHRTPT